MHTPQKPLPAGCDGQGRYTTRRAGDTDYRALLDEPVIRTYRNGQPIAGESAPEDEAPLVIRTDAPRFWVPVALILGLAAFGVWAIS